MKKYMLERYHSRMNLARERLGGICCKCGSDKDLEIDHKEPRKKSFAIAKEWNKSLKHFLKEVDKCQLLCCRCHQIKTCEDNNKQFVKDTNKHGTLSTFRYCKCRLCKKAKADYMQEWRKKNR